jgi:hypothetical protein
MLPAHTGVRARLWLCRWWLPSDATQTPTMFGVVAFGQSNRDFAIFCLRRMEELSQLELTRRMASLAANIATIPDFCMCVGRGCRRGALGFSAPVHVHGCR